MSPTPDTERMELVARDGQLFTDAVALQGRLSADDADVISRLLDARITDGREVGLAEYEREAAEQRVAQLEAACASIVARLNENEETFDRIKSPVGDNWPCTITTGQARALRAALASKPEPQAPESQPPAPDYDHLAKTTFWPAEKPPAEKDGAPLSEAIEAVRKVWGPIQPPAEKDGETAQAWQDRNDMPGWPRRYPGDPEISRAEHLADHLSVHQQDGQPAPAADIPPLGAAHWKAVAELMENRWKDSESLRGKLVEALAEARAASPVPPREKPSIAELQRRVSDAQAALAARVLGDPRECVSSTPANVKEG